MNTWNYTIYFLVLGLIESFFPSMMSSTTRWMMSDSVRRFSSLGKKGNTSSWGVHRLVRGSDAHFHSSSSRTIHKWTWLSAVHTLRSVHTVSSYLWRFCVLQRHMHVTLPTPKVLWETHFTHYSHLEERLQISVSNDTKHNTLHLPFFSCEETQEGKGTCPLIVLKGESGGRSKRGIT